MAAIWSRQHQLASAIHLPDHPITGLATFEVAAGRHEITGALAETLGWQIGAPGIAEEHNAAAPREEAQPSGNTTRQRLLVADVAGRDDLPSRIVGVDQIGGCHLDLDLVEPRIRGDRGHRDIIDL